MPYACKICVSTASQERILTISEEGGGGGGYDDFVGGHDFSAVFFCCCCCWGGGGGGGEGDAMENFPKSRTRCDGGWGHKKVPV